MPVRRLFWLFAALMPMLAAASCVAQGTKTAAAAKTKEGGMLTYSCGEAGALKVQRVANGVHLASAEEAGIDLPAAPAGQDARYSQEPYTLVLDGEDALFVKTGSEPLACTR